MPFTALSHSPIHTYSTIHCHSLTAIQDSVSSFSAWTLKSDNWHFDPLVIGQTCCSTNYWGLQGHVHSFIHSFDIPSNYCLCSNNSSWGPMKRKKKEKQATKINQTKVKRIQVRDWGKYSTTITIIIIHIVLIIIITNGRRRRFKSYTNLNKQSHSNLSI